MAELRRGERVVECVVDCVVDAHAAIGEGAFWSVAQQALYWVDIPAGRLHRHDPTGERDVRWDFGSPLGCIAPVADGSVVLALASGLHQAWLGKREPVWLGGPVPAQKRQRFNDGTLDDRGRFLAGTMAEGSIPTRPSGDGILYRLHADGSVDELLGGFSVINGMAFSPDYRTFYVSDSHPAVRTIWAFDHDPESGTLDNRRVFFNTHAVAGRPDGAAMDDTGCYWMAGVGGWQLLRITPAGVVDMEIPMPVEKPTRIAFGGPDLETLYVTSIHQGLDDTQLRGQPLAGGVFALQVPGVRGCAMPPMPVITAPRCGSPGE